MLKSALVGAALLAVALSSARGTETKGVVCLGANLAKVSDEHTDRLYLRVDDSEPIYFPSRYGGPVVVLRDLDLGIDHVVKVYFDGKIVKSWKLSFTRAKTDTVIVWRAAGSWRMDPCESGECRDAERSG